jgi:putative intracellular protease/amidase
MPTVLFAITAAPVWTLRDGSTLPAGFWAEEVVDPYEILTEAGFTVQFATPGGKQAPLQEYSLDPSMTGSDERSEQLRARLEQLAADLSEPLALADVDPESVDAVYIPGGTGPMEDLHADADLGRLLVALQARNAEIATACHGTIALLSAHADGGRWMFDGYRMTGYSNDEERQGGPGDAAPFTLETRLREEGADYQAGAPWSTFVITDRNLISGQNPASAAEVARQLVASLALA